MMAIFGGYNAYQGYRYWLQVAIIFKTRDGLPQAERNLQIYPKSGHNCVNLCSRSPHCDPMTYPIFFPNGQQGWHQNMPYDPYPNQQARYWANFIVDQTIINNVQTEKPESVLPYVSCDHKFHKIRIEHFTNIDTKMSEAINHQDIQNLKPLQYTK